MIIAIAVIAFFTVVFSILAFILIKYDRKEEIEFEIYIQLFDMITWIVLTSLLSFSIWRIRKYSAMLAHSQIFANERLMLVHLLSFFISTIVSITIETIIITEDIYVAKNDPVSANHRQKRLMLAIFILDYFPSTAQLGIIVTMMIMFVKHSQTISKN